MRTFERATAVILAIAVCAVSILAAEKTSFSGQIQFSGQAEGMTGNAAGVTFSLYAEQAGGVALWVETQNVTVGEGGNYAVVLGSETPGGIPQSIFSSGEARWLEVSYSSSDGSAEVQPRVLLVSVPYAMKASDAD